MRVLAAALLCGASLVGVEARELRTEVEPVGRENVVIVEEAAGEVIFGRCLVIHPGGPLCVGVLLGLAGSVIASEGNDARGGASRLVDDSRIRDCSAERSVLAQRTDVFEQQVRVGIVHALQERIARRVRQANNIRRGLAVKPRPLSSAESPEPVAQEGSADGKAVLMLVETGL